MLLPLLQNLGMTGSTPGSYSHWHVSHWMGQWIGDAAGGAPSHWIGPQTQPALVSPPHCGQIEGTRIRSVVGERCRHTSGTFTSTVSDFSRREVLDGCR